MTRELLNTKLELARSNGEFIGTLKGILWWDIPAELRIKIELKIKGLEDEK